MFISSEDEDNILGHHSRSNLGQQEVSSEDEFEKEMASEVLSAMKRMVSPAGNTSESRPHPTNALHGIFRHLMFIYFAISGALPLWNYSGFI